MNLSQIKRKRMLEFLEKIREQHNDDESLIAINEIENELTNKKYGLVWEEHSEKVDEMLKDNIPVFTEDKSREILSDPSLPYNFLIEGDNLHSLKLLEKTHKGKIDVIYIDPPYNTENSLTYDDTKVGVDDKFRHSKWLSFMDKRLRIAKRLLQKSGIILLSIDDNEAYQLKLLLDDIFSENNLMGVFSVIKAEGGGMAKYVVKGHDLLFVYANNIEYAHPLAKEKDIRGKKITIDNIEYWIQEDAVRESFGAYGNLYYEDILKKRGIEFKQKIDLGIKNKEYILVQKPSGKSIIGKLRRIDEDYSKFYSVMKHLNADGVTTLKKLGLADDFDYPKPVSLIKELIKGATFFSKHDPIILDFFAGSGTTAQAVLELNHEDKKHRTFILCTSNELSSKSKLSFVKSLGYLKDYDLSTQTSDKTIENKIYSIFPNGKDGFLDLLKSNKVLYDSFGICQKVTYTRIKMIIEGYVSKIPETQIIFDKKITIKNLNEVAKYKLSIDELADKREYEEYKVKLTSDNRIQLIANSSDYKHYEGIPANLKYLKTDFVAKTHSDIQEEILNHTKELIELEHHTNLANQEYIIIKNDKEADLLEKNISDYPNLKGLYIYSDVLLSNKQKLLFKNLDIKFIPDYFYRNELCEIGEV